MNQELTALSQRYAAALGKHLRQRPRASFSSARGLGRKAVAIGLETLDVARMHDRALAALETASSRDGIIKRAEIFFTEAIMPIENTHQAALKTNARLSQVSKKLGRRTADLAASNRSLKQGITRRKTVEMALEKSVGHSQKLLKESRQLQKHLQQLTHRILSAQENKRKKISVELENEIAQTLLGINVRLLSLKKEAAASEKSFKKDIASTQRLVVKSLNSINNCARVFSARHEA
ncbi:MAG: hypothetical protein QOJ40_2602 [Verrucomicrobiota bacterium]